ILATLQKTIVGFGKFGKKLLVKIDHTSSIFTLKKMQRNSPYQSKKSMIKLKSLYKIPKTSYKKRENYFS
ncbi:hypothetical protein, partial [Tenacibaculum maritimum]|uniref:hypothetical protein n=1 Tax=Tenacibaculum maritimum TaxID=107401 RepID=UPI00387724F7